MGVRRHGNQNIAKDPKFKKQIDLVVAERKDCYDYVYNVINI